MGVDSFYIVLSAGALYSCAKLCGDGTSRLYL
jgi:hypothetical protein